MDGLEQAFEWIQAKGARATRADYASLLKRCGVARVLDFARRAYESMARSRHHDELSLRNLSIEMFGKCGDIEVAREIFHGLWRPNLFSWTMILAACARNGRNLEALLLVRRMIGEGARPDVVCFVTILDLCAATADLEQGKVAHAWILACGVESSSRVLGNALINMYGKCRNLDLARAQFDRMEHQDHGRDVVTWNSLLAAFTHNGYLEEAARLFQEMEVEGIKPSSVTLTCVLESCSGDRQGKLFHDRVLDLGLQGDEFLMNSLVKMYARCGRLEESRLVFRAIDQKDIISWNVMISLEARLGSSEEAVELLREIDLEGFPEPDEELVSSAGFDDDLLLGNAVVNMFGKSGCLDAARATFDRLPVKNVVSWNCLISGYAQNLQGRRCLELFRQMDQEGVKANSVTFVSLLDACSTIPALDFGRELHLRITAAGLELHTVVATALINMYGKCEELQFAQELLERYQSTGLVACNVMISAYAQVGHSERAMKFLHGMDLAGVKADVVTYIGALEACACSKDFSKGQAVYDRVVSTGWISQLVIANSVINMLGKSGRVLEAAIVFDRMEKRDSVSWNAIAAAYAQNGHPLEALELFWRMQQQGVRAQEATFVTILDACGDSSSLLAHGRSIAKLSSWTSDAIKGALLGMYSKCGCVDDALAALQSLSSRGLLAWTSMLAAYAHVGRASEALRVLGQMQHDGVVPDDVAFSAVVFACSHAGLLHEALVRLAWVYGDYGTAMGAGLYECVVDVLGRMGRLQEAEELMHAMPYEPDSLAWMALLGACTVHGDLERGARTAGHEALLDSGSGRYVLLSNMYASWED
ncbi:pentatricopeptide repeat-containing protein At3g09040, mitochondrial [Selaginella moellendorffii]|uniref:pentatricopeptide repeat-containing protein At3g09040, mitochondrial n=1 Tax=Selaginella moellendorffii TaxID=88036 RepID=UPI000D1C3607|nr:pentatricopeptide repeat-containing protein At3g09040, mitochondrial [Selaginella moellendorffii]|eukprot:XP_024530690.1 pentatricopeptide repeat-containing protein At3g09040, mitochondrial [Selaginella moellendorffii]